MVQTQTSEMLRNKLMPQEQSRDGTGGLQNLNTATLPAWERRNGPNSDFKDALKSIHATRAKWR